MKKLFAFALAAIMSLSMVACSSEGNSESKAAANKLEEVMQKGYITLAVSPDFAPNEFLDPNKEGQDAVVGCDIELAKYIADYIGVDLKIEQMDFQTCQAAASTGKVDFSLNGYAKLPEREENMECSVYYNWDAPDADDGLPEHIVIVPAGEEENYKTAEDFAGKKLAVQSGSLQYNLAVEQLPSDVQMEYISSLNDGIMMVATGKVDGLVCAYDTAIGYCDNYDEIGISVFEFEYESDGTIAIAQKGQTELMAKINEAIEKATAEGLFPQWKADAMEYAKSLGIDVEE